MKTHLTSIAEHSDWLFSQHIYIDEKWSLHRQRVDFGKQPLALWMFVPCQLVGNEFANWQPMEEPKEKDFWESMPRRNGKRAWNTHCDLFEIALKECQQAKDRVLFDGFFNVTDTIVSAKNISINFIDGKIYLTDFDFEYPQVSIISTIEDIVKYKPLLTATAQKKIGL